MKVKSLAAALLTLAFTAPAFAASKGEPIMAMPKLHAINLNEIEAGNFIARRGCDPEVRDLAALIARDHKRLDNDLQLAAREQVVPLGEVMVDAYEQRNFEKQMADTKALKAMRTCARDVAFLRSMRDGHIFARNVLDEALSDPASLSIRGLLLDASATVPVHYNGSVRLLEKLEASAPAVVN